MDQQITCAAKPREKRCRGQRVEKREMSAGRVYLRRRRRMSMHRSYVSMASNGAVCGSMAKSTEMLRDVQVHMVDMKCPAEKREHAEHEPGDETNEIKQFPAHF